VTSSPTVRADRSALAERVAALSPRRRRWLRFLRSLPLDPYSLGRPLDEPGEDDVIVCGCPRTGSSLLAAALFQPPQCISVMEPWDGMRLPPAPLFDSLRTELATTGRLTRGRLDVPELLASGRVRWWPEGEVAVPVDHHEDSVVAVKWPGYWVYLDLLPATKFVVTLRHPAEVIASFKAEGGRAALGLQRETRFNSRLNHALESATADPALRRVLLFDHVHSQLLPHLERPGVFVVRYERWQGDADGLLHDLGDFLGCDLSAPAVRIEPRQARAGLDDLDRELIATRCRTAAALGYDL
jgi:hypothetical protein